MKYPNTLPLLKELGIDITGILAGSITSAGYETAVADGSPRRAVRHSWPEGTDVDRIVAALDADYAAIGETRPV